MTTGLTVLTKVARQADTVKLIFPVPKIGATETVSAFVLLVLNLEV